MNPRLRVKHNSFTPEHKIEAVANHFPVIGESLMRQDDVEAATRDLLAPPAAESARA